MKIYDYINKDLLNDMIEKKYINVYEHPSFGYRIFNYSKSCVYDHVWNDATERCRGLIVDSNYNIIARPFPKFYNYEEILDKDKIPDCKPFKIYEKKDGTLGILYWSTSCAPKIATRGSFQNTQSVWATNFLNKNLTLGQLEELMKRTIDYEEHDGSYSNRTLLRVKYTLLFEIVYPENRYVVNYGDEQSLTLLAVINNETGEEIDPETFSDLFPVIKSYPVPDDWKLIRNVYAELGDSEEGFVIKFPNNFRVKMKFDQYFKKHFISSGLSKKRICEFISDGDVKSLMEIVNTLDEENKMYYRNVFFELWKRYHEIEYEAYEEYKYFRTDKDAAEYFKTCKHRHILFNIRKGRDYSKYIWNFIKNELKEL